SPNACIMQLSPGLLSNALAGRHGDTRKWGRAMGNCLRQLVVLSSVALRRRKYWLLAAFALASSSLGVSEPALAQCAPPPGSYGTAISPICTSGGNPYAGGINYNTDNGLGGFPINLQLLSGVNVSIPAGPGSVNAVNLASTGGVTAGAADLTIMADGVTISNALNPGTSNSTGLRMQSS